MVTSPIIFHCFSQGNLQVSHSLSPEKYWTKKTFIYLYTASLLQTLSPVQYFPICHIFLISHSPLGHAHFLLFLLIFSVESSNMTFTLLFSEHWGMEIK